MGLPARQRRVLDRIESALRGSDPKLAALYAIFAKLTRDEEMPRIEQLRHNAVRVAARLRLRMGIAGSHLFGRLIPRQRSLLFFPLALGLTVASIVFAARSSSGNDCQPVTQLAASSTSSHVAHSKVCKTPPYLMGFGH